MAFYQKTPVPKGHWNLEFSPGSFSSLAALQWIFREDYSRFRT